MRSFVYKLSVVVFLLVIVFFLINNNFVLHLFEKKKLNCGDFNWRGNEVDCSYVLVDAGMTVKVVLLNNVYLKDEKYYLSFYRYLDENKKKIIMEKMPIGKVNENYKTIQFKIQGDNSLYSTFTVSDVPMLPQEFQNYFVEKNLKGKNAVVSYTGKDGDRVNIIIYRN